jgi:hypothetical protein
MSARDRRRVDPYQARPILQPIDWLPECPQDRDEPAHALAAGAISLVQMQAFGEAKDAYARAHELLAFQGTAADRARCLLDEGCFWHRRRDSDASRHLATALAAYMKAWEAFSRMEGVGDPGYDPLDRADCAFAIATCQEDVATDLPRRHSRRPGTFQESLRWYEEALARTEAAGAAEDVAWVLFSRANLFGKLAREPTCPDPEAQEAQRAPAHADLDQAFTALDFDERILREATVAPEIVAASIVRRHGGDRSATLAFGLFARANLWGSGPAESKQRAIALQSQVNATFALLQAKAQERKRSGEHVTAIWYDQLGDPAQALVHARAALREADTLTRSALTWESMLERRGQLISSSQLAVRLCLKLDPRDQAGAFALAQEAKGHLASGLAQQVTSGGGDRQA